MIEQPIEGNEAHKSAVCSQCRKEIPYGNDDIQPLHHKRTIETGVCDTCREKGTIEERLKKCDQQREKTDTKKIYEEIKKQEQRIAKPLEEYLPETLQPNHALLFDEYNRPLPNLVISKFAEYIINNPDHRILTDSETDFTYYWSKNTKTFRSNGRDLIDLCAKRLLSERATSNKVKAITQLITIDKHEIKKSEFIAVENGILQITANSVELLPFSPDIFVTTKLNVCYKPEAKSLAWNKFIEEVIPDTKARDHLQECLGTTLIKKPLAYIFYWYGPKGRNGKTTLIKTLYTLFGTQNCASIQVTELDGKNRFSEANLHDKLVNFSSEPPTKRSLAPETLKALSGGDVRDMEIKGKQTRISSTIHAKIFIVGNSFPKLDSTGNAWWERVHFTKFTQTFIGEKQVIDIEEKWLSTEEGKSAVLNWIIEGTKRVIKNNYKIDTTSQSEAQEEIKLASDHLTVFYEKHITKKEGQKILRTDLYQKYLVFCDFRNIVKPYGMDILNKKLIDEGITSARKVLVKGENAQQLWLGIDVIPITKEIIVGDDTLEEAPKNGTLDVHLPKTLSALSAKRPFYTANNSNVQNIPVTKGLFVDNADNVPVYKWKLIPTGEKCLQCMNFAVQYLLINPAGSEERLCENCFDLRKKSFTVAQWVHIDTEILPNVEGKCPAPEGDF